MPARPRGWTYTLLGGAALTFLMPGPLMAEDEDDDVVVLTGLVRDFRAAHEDFGDPEPDDGYGHYAGNISQIIGSDGAPLQVHGVSDFVIDLGTLIPGVPYAARATVLGAEITSGGVPVPVTIQAETDTQLFEPYGSYNDPGGTGSVNDGENPRHFIFSLTEIYSAETPISIKATSWLPGFPTLDLGYNSVYPTSGTEARGAQLATRVTMPEDGYITSITAYLYRDSTDSNDIRYALYEDNGGEPGARIVQTNQGNQNQGWGWETKSIADTWIAAGDYWLAVAHDNQDQLIRYQTNSGYKTRQVIYNGVDGFKSNWGSSNGSWNNRRVSIYASYTPVLPTYTEHITARSGDNSPQVLVLRDGSDVPSIPAFQDQTNLAVFVQPYVNVATGKIVLQDNQAIYLYELGTTNLTSAAADFQDLVIMVTLATDPLYFYQPDLETEGFNPIGFKVDDEWQDVDGNKIAPHVYLPSWGDTAGSAGATSSGGVTSPATFYQWFRDILATNMAAVHAITLTYDDDVWEYSTGDFHPIDGQLFGNEGGSQNKNFTFAVGATFTYDASADQWFEFDGGDGAWLFVDGKLLIDLGGVDSSVKQHGDLDRLGLVDGQTYQMSLFYANRDNSKKFELYTNVFLTPGPLLGTISGVFD